MKGFIITSEIDENYFIINNGVFYITVLASLLSKIDNKVANNLLSINEVTAAINDFIFIEKNSELGMALNELIKEKKLIDGNQIIEENHLINALINQNLNNNDLVEYLKIIIRMIKNENIGSIEELKTIYPETTLKKINKDARYIWASSKANSTKKYYKEIRLNGYENNGVTYYNNEWCYIDIVNKSIIPIEKPKQRLRSNEK